MLWVIVYVKNMTKTWMIKHMSGNAKSAMVFQRGSLKMYHIFLIMLMVQLKQRNFN